LVPEVVSLLGGIVSAVIIALPLNTFFQFVSAESILLTPLIEEPVKAIGVTFLALRYSQVVSTKRRGLILGGFGGLGFAFTENLYYATIPGTDVVARALLPVPMHVMASGIAGLGLVYFAQSRMDLGKSERVRNSKNFSLRTIGSLWAVAMLMHGQYNFLSYFGHTGSLLGLVITGFVYYRLSRSLPEELHISSLPGPVKLLRSTVQVRVLREIVTQPKVVSVARGGSERLNSHCINCGRRISPSERFCDSCGASQHLPEGVLHS
jgi:hypothetical protein